MDPKTFQRITDNESCPYKLTKRSDIYSLSPFVNFEYGVSLQLDILNGKREKSVPNTNPRFVKLYQNEQLTIYLNRMLELNEKDFNL